MNEKDEMRFNNEDEKPYIPSWNYPNNSPKMCPCGHHEGYHNDDRQCLLRHKCGCIGLPSSCFTTDEEFFNGEKVKIEEKIPF